MLAILSHPVIGLILGPKWDGTAPILTWLAFSAIGYLTASALPSLAMATNRTRLAFIRLAIEFCVKVPLIVSLGAIMQVQGVLIGHAVSSAVSFFVSLILVQNLIGLTVRRQLLALSRPILAAIPMALFLLPMSSRFHIHDMAFTLFLNLCWVCGLACIIYAGGILILWKLAGSPDGCEAVAIRIAKRLAGRFNRAKAR
jgi:O-antigen/teichoic acid export membrane protein